MSDQIKAGDMIFRAGDGGQGGKGGDLHVGPGTYKAGDAIQQKQDITVQELTNFLIPIIQAHPDLDETKKATLIDKLKNGVKDIGSIAGLAKLLFEVFGG